MARNPVYNDDTAKLAKKRYDLSREYTRPYFDRFLDNYKHYFLRTIDEAIEGDADAYPFYSNLMLPISYQVVETILPRMFSRLPNFSIATEETNDEQDEMAMRELVRYQLNHPYLVDDPIYARIVAGLKELFITGNMWGEVPWQLVEGEVQEWQPYSMNMGLEPSWDNLAILAQYGQKPDWKLVKVKRKLIDAPVFQHRSIFHVFPDPKKKRVSDLDWVIIEDDMTLDRLMEMIEVAPNMYQNVDVLKKMKANKDNGEKSMTNYDREIAQMFGGDDYTNKDNEDGQFKVWFMRERDKYSIVINEKLTIRDGDNPNGDGKLGLFLAKDIIVPGQLYAWGEPDPIKKIEDSMSDQANMRNDNVFYDLMRMWKLDPQALVEGEEFVPEPGTVVQMTNMDGLQPLETGTTKASPYREYQEWEKIVQNTTGVSDYATGQADSSLNDTKGGIELLQQAANARFAMKLQLFEQLALKAMGTMYVQRNIRFFDAPQAVNTERGKILITPDQIRRIRGNIHFIVDSGSTEAINKQTEISKWKMIAENIGKPPFENLSQNAKDKIARKMLFSLGETEVEELIEREALPIAAPGGANGDLPLQSVDGIASDLLPADQSTPPVGGTPLEQNTPAIPTANPETTAV